jgi:hypothetical protein
MRDSSAMSRRLQKRLDKVPAPPDYESLRDKLINSRPTLEPLIVKESPENIEPTEKSK